MATKEASVVVVTEVVENPPPEPVTTDTADDKPAAKAGKAKKPKAKKAPAPRKPRSAPVHPPYEVIVKDAIVTLKEMIGSSLYAITKFIGEKHKQMLPNFKKLLLFHLKKLVSSNKIVKVKNSFKLLHVRSSAPKLASPVKKKLMAAAKLKAKVVVRIPTFGLVHALHARSLSAKQQPHVGLFPQVSKQKTA
ncbi:histone H1.2-like [Pyrus x bretschneideri]|uniref:histone H1.2-like n=1 Tax=Pyrus x bretschneideri TaxID=225117 RepID=UPI00202E6600|nr:histone H1.2-like [Pyrus x bretschneideri]